MTHPVGDTLNQYKQVHAVTDSVNLKTLLETTVQDGHAVVFAPGNYVFDDYIFYRRHNTHWFAEESSYMASPGVPRASSLVKIRAPIRMEGAQAWRMTGIDFYHTENTSCFFTMGGTVFVRDCWMVHDAGLSTWSGGAWSCYGTSLSIECERRNCDVDFSQETEKGAPIKMKDGGFLRMTASANGWLPRVFNKGPIAAIQLAGVGAYLHNVAIYGPGKFSGIPGVLAARANGEAYWLQDLGSSPRVKNCGTAFQATSFGAIGFRSVGGTAKAPFKVLVEDCHRALSDVGGGRLYDARGNRIEGTKPDLQDFKLSRVNLRYNQIV